jgi:hypothetical protein
MDIFLISLLASIAALVVGSRLTRPEPDGRWQEVQDRLHTPVSVDHAPAAERRARAGEAEARGEGLLIVDLARLHHSFSLQRYRIDLLGALGALAVVGGLVGLAFLITRV